jgi:hypothetical protein
MTSVDEDQLWNALCVAENAFYNARMAEHVAEKAFDNARMALIQSVRDDSLTRVIASALGIPHQRGTALRLLLILPEEMSRRHLPMLVYLASVGHSDIVLVREVIERIDREWLVANVDEHATDVLSRGDEEEFRRIAELYERLSEDLLTVHLERCAQHADPEVKEIARDYQTSESTG